MQGAPDEGKLQKQAFNTPENKLATKIIIPIIIDPSHATGHWELVEGVSLAAIAAGADGLMIEVHNAPEHALSDGGESLRIDKFEKLMNKAKKLAEFMNKPI